MVDSKTYKRLKHINGLSLMACSYNAGYEDASDYGDQLIDNEGISYDDYNYNGVPDELESYTGQGMGNDSNSNNPMFGGMGSIDFTYNADKIGKQMIKRGWTNARIQEVLDNPTRTVKTSDTRYLPGGSGLKNNDPATAYYHKDGGYVVRNDKTGDIVQVSDVNDDNWKAPWDDDDDNNNPGGSGAGGSTVINSQGIEGVQPGHLVDDGGFIRNENENIIGFYNDDTNTAYYYYNYGPMVFPVNPGSHSPSFKFNINWRVVFPRFVFP